MVLYFQKPHEKTDCVLLLVVVEADVVARLGEGIPGNVEPGLGGEELVGEGVGLEEVDEALELSWILRTDISSLAYEVLRVFNTPYPTIDSLTAEARIDDDGAYNLAGLALAADDSHKSDSPQPASWGCSPDISLDSETHPA